MWTVKMSVRNFKRKKNCSESLNPRKDDDGSDWNWALIFIVRDESWRASMNFFILIFSNMHTTETGHQFSLMIGFDGAKVSSSYHIIACFNLKAFLCLRFAAKGTSAELRFTRNFEWQTVMKKNLLGTKLCNRMSNLRNYPCWAGNWQLTQHENFRDFLSTFYHIL